MKTQLDRRREDEAIVRFKADRDDLHCELLGRCADFDAEIAIQKLDFYDAPLAATAAQRLREYEALLEGYAKQVYDAHDENR